MDFKKLNPRALILLSAAVFMVFGTVILKIFYRGPNDEQTLQPVIDKPPVLTIAPIKNDYSTRDFSEEDSQSMKEMKEQMDSDRLQQKKIKMLKLQLEQTNLQLEQEKALSEISKLEHDNTSIVNDSNDQGQDKYPDVKVIYIGGTTEDKQAILSINGNSSSCIGFVNLVRL